MHPDRAALPLPDSQPLSPPDGFTDRALAVGVTVDAAQIAKLGDYLGRLLAMNELMNLTAISDPADAWEKHGLDSLALVPFLAELPPGGRLVDVGSGGGVPGIPIAILRPDLAITLVEATQKKAHFLEAVVEALGIDNVEVRAERAEQVIASDAGEFDVATARAVARLSKLLPFTAPLVEEGGYLLLVKGQRADEELAEAARELRKFRMTHERTVTTPTGRIVVLRRKS